MEKYDNIIKSAEIRKLVEKKMYQKALEILDTMDVERVKVLTDLSVFAEVYIQTERYEDAEELLLRLREQSGSRRIVYQLIKLAVHSGNVDDAEYYYDEYVSIAPRDSERFILRYRIDKMKGENLEVLIRDLEELKEYDYVEKWSYELAKLYHKAGLKDKCVRECSDIILWFGEGIIVEKAKMLKEHYVGVPKHIEAIRTEKKKEIEEKKGLYKTKDLSNETEEVQGILSDAELLEEEERAVEELVSQEEAKEDLFEEEQEMKETISAESELDKEDKQVSGTNTKEIEKKEVGNQEKRREEAHTQYEKSSGENMLFLNDIFGNFCTNEELVDQLDVFVRNRIKAKDSCNFTVVGPRRSGRTTLAKLMIRSMNQYGMISFSKAAKITAAQINKIQLAKAYDKLKDGAIIIEQAGELSEEAISNLVEMMLTLHGHILVVLEDTKEQLEQLFDNYGSFAEVFTERVVLPTYDKKDLMGFAISYIEKEGLAVGQDTIPCIETVCNQIATNVYGDNRLESTVKIMKKVVESAKENPDAKRVSPECFSLE